MLRLARLHLCRLLALRIPPRCPCRGAHCVTKTPVCRACFDAAPHALQADYAEALYGDTLKDLEGLAIHQRALRGFARSRRR